MRYKIFIIFLIFSFQSVAIIDSSYLELTDSLLQQNLGTIQKFTTLRHLKISPGEITTAKANGQRVANHIVSLNATLKKIDLRGNEIDVPTYTILIGKFPTKDCEILLGPVPTSPPVLSPPFLTEKGAINGLLLTEVSQQIIGYACRKWGYHYLGHNIADKMRDGADLGSVAPWFINKESAIIKFGTSYAKSKFDDDLRKPLKESISQQTQIAGLATAAFIVWGTPYVIDTVKRGFKQIRNLWSGLQTAPSEELRRSDILVILGTIGTVCFVKSAINTGK